MLAHELAHVVQQAGATKSSLNIQREPDKKPKRRDVVVIGEDWKGSEELALVLAPGAFVVRVKSMHEVVMKLAKINFPVGTLYIITHSAPTGELQFGTAEGTIKPADIAGKLKGALSTDNAPDVVDFRGCSVGTSPKAMDQIGAALGAKSIIAGDCFAVIQRSKSVLINGKAITRELEVTEKAADDDQNKKRRDLFMDLLRKNAETFGGAKKCIVMWRFSGQVFHARKLRIHFPEVDQGQGLHGDAADTMQKLANLRFQPVAAFLDAIEDVILYARAVDLKQAGEKFPPFALNHAARAPRCAGPQFLTIQLRSHGNARVG